MEKTKRAPVAKGILKAARPEPAMAVIIRDKPPTYDWGWFSREDQRMHLQSVDKLHRRLHYKVWLEERGRRVIEPEPGIPAKVWKILQAEIVKQRLMIEAFWIALMIKNGWLKAQLKGGVIALTAYPNTPNRFERTIGLSDLVPNEAVAAKVTSQDVALNEEYSMLEIFPKMAEGSRVHEPLEKVLWTG